MFRWILWGALGAWAIGLGVFSVTRPKLKNPEIGEQLLSAGLLGQSMDGGRVPLLPRDSVVAVLAATSECGACRNGIPTYRQIAARLEEEGVAFRIVVGSDSLAARQFSRLLPQFGEVVWDPGQKLFRSIGVRNVPSLYLVGRDGRLLKRWTPLPGDVRIAEVVAREARAAGQVAVN